MKEISTDCTREVTPHFLYHRRFVPHTTLHDMLKSVHSSETPVNYQTTRRHIRALYSLQSPLLWEPLVTYSAGAHACLPLVAAQYRSVFHWPLSNRLQGAETLYNHHVVVEGEGQCRHAISISHDHVAKLWLIWFTQGLFILIVLVGFRWDFSLRGWHYCRLPWDFMVTWPFAPRRRDLRLCSEKVMKVFPQFNVSQHKLLCVTFACVYIHLNSTEMRKLLQKCLLFFS